MIHVCQYSEYTLGYEYGMVLNMLGLHMVLNNTFIIDIWQVSEYASSSEYARVTHSSVENGPSYMFDRVLNIPRVLNMLGL